jgi:hypothetical protein
VSLLVSRTERSVATFNHMAPLTGFRANHNPPLGELGGVEGSGT